MKASIKLYTNDGHDKKGFYPVKLIISDSKQGTKRKTLFKTDLKFWDKSNELPKFNHPNFQELFETVTKYRQKINSISFSRIKNINTAFEYVLSNDADNDIDFYVYAEKRIKEMIDLNRNGNANAYRDAVNSLKTIKPQLQFSEIDTFLINAFIKHLKTKEIYKGNKLKQIGLKNTSIRTYVNEIKAIYNSCLIDNKGLTDSKPFVGYTKTLPISKRRIKNVYIDSERFKKLESNKLDIPYLERSRKLVLLQFYLGGLDFTDLYHLKKSQIKKGRLYYKRSKLGERGYTIDVKVFDKANKIIKEFNTKDSEYIFNWRKDLTGYKTFRNNHVRDLRRVFEMLEIDTLPIQDNFGTKAIRHSFATIAKFKHIDPDIIRELMGHERNEIDTIYKDKYPEAIRDNAHLEIITF